MRHLKVRIHPLHHHLHLKQTDRWDAHNNMLDQMVPWCYERNYTYSDDVRASFQSYVLRRVLLLWPVNLCGTAQKLLGDRNKH